MLPQDSAIQCWNFLCDIDQNYCHCCRISLHYTIKLVLIVSVSAPNTKLTFLCCHGGACPPDGMSSQCFFYVPN